MVLWSPSLYGFTDKLRWAGWPPEIGGADRDRQERCLQNFILISVFVPYRPRFSPSDNLRVATRFLVFGVSERIFCRRIPFSSSPYRSRSPQLTSNLCIGWCIRSRNPLPAQSLTGHLTTRWKTSALGDARIFVQAGQFKLESSPMSGGGKGAVLRGRV